MAAYTDTLKPFEYDSLNYRFDSSPFNKIEFVKQPKRSVKSKTLISPQLSFNPQLNTIHQTISDSNLAFDIKTNFENINYRPITSSGYRGFSGLNTRKNGVKQTFQEVTYSSYDKELMCSYDKDCQNKNCIYTHSTISDAVRTTLSDPLN